MWAWRGRYGADGFTMTCKDARDRLSGMSPIRPLAPWLFGTASTEQRPSHACALLAQGLAMHGKPCVAEGPAKRLEWILARIRKDRLADMGLAPHDAGVDLGAGGTSGATSDRHCVCNGAFQNTLLSAEPARKPRLRHQAEVCIAAEVRAYDSTPVPWTTRFRQSRDPRTGNRPTTGLPSQPVSALLVPKSGISLASRSAGGSAPPMAISTFF